jgi:CO/xanthine dehydrogenase FAD-binding subunit
MRSFVPAFELVAPRSLGEALALLDREPGVWRPFAGGTDLMVLLEAGKLEHKKWVSIRDLAELRGIAESAAHVDLGAAVTYGEVLESPTLAREFPSLVRAAAETGAVAIQNRGTLGGNIANASPAADSPPALLVYEAEIELASARGARWVRYADFHTGYKRTVMDPRELIRRIRLPRGAAGVHYYRKVGTRRAQAISKVVLAGLGRAEAGRIADIRIALGSVAPTTIRCRRTEALLAGRLLEPATIDAARRELAAEIAPIDDIRSSAAFRRRVAQNLLAEFLEGLSR